jgi:hypothetical protein
MHLTKVGCCLKKQDHCQRHYVVVLTVVIGDGLPDWCCHCCHPHNCHHRRNCPISPHPQMHRTKVGCCLKNKIIAIVITSLSLLFFHCCYHHCHSHCQYCRNHPPLSLSGMNPTKVGCCLKKQGHGHCPYGFFTIIFLRVGIIELSAFH